MRVLHLSSLILIFFFGCKSKDVKKPVSFPQKQNEVFVVAFGSCNKQYEENPFWDDILAQSPNVWIWGGDNIYADTEDMERLRSMYEQQNNVPGYRTLTSEIPVIGTWDDHDYGINDGGEEFVMKKESQQLFLDFMGISEDDERRNREGVYAAHEFETPQGRVKVMVLDTRYFRSNLKKDENPNRRFKINDSADATILGAAQWNWLQQELMDSDADFNLIVTSIQFLSREHGFETWGNFPKEIERLNELILNSNAKGVIVLSGDRHISEFSRTTLDAMEYPLVDFTSSGLTHSYSNFTSETNRFRVGEVTSVPSFGLILLDFAKKKAKFQIRGENDAVYQELEQQY